MAALEPHFWERLLRELGIDDGGRREELEIVFASESAEYWEEWAAARDLPLAAVRETEQIAGGRDMSPREKLS